jgi:hypothetical protein
MLSEMGSLKAIINFFDIFFITIWGFTVIDIMPLLVVKGGYDIFNSVDSSIKVASAFVGLIYFSCRIYFYVHKSKNEVLIQKQQIREMEIKNNKMDLNNYMFRGQINDL